MADKEGNIPDVCTWKTENGRVEINIIADAPKDIVLKMDKGSKLNIKHSEKNLEIVISKQQQQQQQQQQEEEGEKPAVKSQETAKMEQNQGSNNGQGDKQSEDASNKRSENASNKQIENAWRKRSENVLGNVVNMLKEHRGVVVAAVIAISLGLLLRRKFKAV